ncbi:molybdenum cofactor guanylyltransferase [Phenylobacterium sp.]|uniref:molybdenum cofactor guanylyltransferase n=1 Tax=Phenylobacterium sp. TaxID=1871053 RepID=UPI0035B356D1
MAAGTFVTVLLAGGEGRRMGGAKPLRLLDGRPLLDHGLRIARAQGPGPLAVAVRTPGQVGGRSDVPLLLDPIDCVGPLAGLASALAFAEACGAGQVLTLPCDAPRLPLDLGARLAGALAPGDQVAMAFSRGRLHPTCALWRVSTRAALDAYRASGGRSLKGLAQSAGVSVVDWGDPDPDPFVNLNTPEDLAAAAGMETALD